MAKKSKSGTLETKILDLLKNQYIIVKGEFKQKIIAGSPKHEYYLEEWEDNLIFDMDDLHQKQFDSGSGSELKKKMNALRSSSAMTFNLLGNESLMIKDNPYFGEGRYAIQYEKKLRTLKGRGNPANLDAELYSAENEEYIFCEMKMLEYLGASTTLNRSYLDPKNYKLSTEDASVFINAFESLCVKPFPDKGDIQPLFKSYDAFQMLKHTLSIYNAVNNLELHTAKKITLLNVVWEIKDSSNLCSDLGPKYNDIITNERNEFHDFKKVCKPIVQLFKNKGISFSVQYLAHHELIDLLELTNEHIDGLKRYDIG